MINNSYNARLDSFANRVVRGRILAADGTVLAENRTDGEGNETRIYPFGTVFDHVVGYSSNGKTGIESLANFYLLTSHVNLAEQVVNELGGTKSQGDDVYTTLDPELQQAAWAALGDRRGAVIAMEPDTGKILAMVSKPGYDPNTLAQDWEVLNADGGGQSPLLNRAAQGLYPPGSTFKIVTALEYMREHPQDYKDYRFDCSGTYVNGDYTIRCYHGESHGSQDFVQAFANSCNGAFASLGLELDLASLRGTAEELLFNRELPPYRISLQGELLCHGAGGGNLGNPSDLHGTGKDGDDAPAQRAADSGYRQRRDTHEALSSGPGGECRGGGSEEIYAGGLGKPDDSPGGGKSHGAYGGGGHGGNRLRPAHGRLPGGREDRLRRV